MSKKPYVIVFGNEKGGTGKSTTAMHVMTALMRMGYKVGSMDIDARQGTFTRYVENRRHYVETSQKELPLPTLHMPILRTVDDLVKVAEAKDQENLQNAFAQMASNDFIVIDTPGNDTFLSRLAHSYADTLITPINDSFLDLDVLVHLQPDSLDMKRPSIYSDWVWDQKKIRAARDRGMIDWVILRNRLSSMQTRNRDKMNQVLNILSKRLGFRLAQGFNERVIFRELFTSGLTVLDLRDADRPLTLSHMAAKAELMDLMKHINLPNLKEKIAKEMIQAPEVVPGE
jgi:chromosome partitioning protein